ncbi:MAG TPA: helix-turn-helix transcriptional regulator [Ignavibacteria bacterium]|nr:helix-turn-helix transcriptional regulator [Ignavibacteria bacterium]HMR41567.1 helix-turn-helix transcriptional regulator [Ignavibacteria bacterium]
MADIKTFAADLKAVREEKNLTLKGISQQTRLNISILENIENGDFTFQPQAYIRAFLKQYINSLDLDIDETLFDYDLARSGKYKPKQSSYNTESPQNSEEIPEQKSSRTKITDKLKGMVDSQKKAPAEKISDKTEDELTIEIPDKKEEINKNISENIKEEFANEESEEANTEKEEENIEDLREKLRNELREEMRNEIRQEIKKEIPEVKNDIKKEVKAEKNYIQKKPEEKYYTKPDKSRDKSGISLAFLNSPAIRNIFMILFVILVLVGIYSLVNILFLEGSKDKPEVIRQNFDDVVKEQEQKILGKRTPEEIQDSIRRAEEELAAAGDSITLKVTGLGAGSFYLITDSVNYSKPEKITFTKGETGVFKAKKNFFISAENTEIVKATVNDVPIKFGNKSVSKVKIGRSGVIR